MLDTLDEPVLDPHREQFAALDEEEIRTLVGLLDRVRETS